MRFKSDAQRRAVFACMSRMTPGQRVSAIIQKLHDPRPNMDKYSLPDAQDKLFDDAYKEYLLGVPEVAPPTKVVLKGPEPSQVKIEDWVPEKEEDEE